MSDDGGLAGVGPPPGPLLRRPGRAGDARSARSALTSPESESSACVFQPIWIVSRVWPVAPSYTITLSPDVHATYVPFSEHCTGPPLPCAVMDFFHSSAPVWPLNTHRLAVVAWPWYVNPENATVLPSSLMSMKLRGGARGDVVWA